MSGIYLPNNWTPRPDQEKLWKYLHNGGTRALQIAHRRWGKDDVALHYTACAAHERIGVYWHMLPQAKQARKAIWTAINPRTGKFRIDEAFPPEIRHSANDTEMNIRLKCGSFWQVVGSDNYNSLVGAPPVGIVNSEYALADPHAWGYFSPILEENKGWSLFITTPRGKNHAYRMLRAVQKRPEWHAEILRADQTNVFSSEQLKRILAELIELYGKDTGEAMYRQEYLCDFDAPILGAYYAGIINDLEARGQINSIPHMPSRKVITCWDRGYADKTSIWFMQYLSQGVHFLDFYENNQKPPEHYINMLHIKAREEGYIYDTTASGKIKAIGPHDMFSHEPGSGKTYAELADKLGVAFVKAPDVSIADGIDAVRMTLPTCTFNREKCDEGIELLKMYRAQDNKMEKYKILGEPLHDFTSHCADSMRYGVLCYREQTGILVKPVDTRMPTLNEMWGMHDAARNRRAEYY